MARIRGFLGGIAYTINIDGKDHRIGTKPVFTE